MSTPPGPRWNTASVTPIAPPGRPPSRRWRPRWRPSRRARRWIAVAVAVLLVVGAVVTLLVVLPSPAPPSVRDRPLPGGPGLDPAGPDARIAAALADLRSWDGITYTGRYGRLADSDLRIDVTVDRYGDMVGRLNRIDGSTADFARIGGVDLMRAGPGWFADDPDVRARERFTGMWVADPVAEIGLLGESLPSPETLEPDLAPADFGLEPSLGYRDLGPITLDGVAGRRLRGFGEDVAVTAGRTPTLLGYRPVGQDRVPDPLRVSRATPRALAGIATVRPERDAPTALDVLRAGPVLDVRWEPDPPDRCDAACSATVRVTNVGRYPARGLVTVYANGTGTGQFDYALARGESRLFTATLPDPPGDVSWDVGTTDGP